MAQTVKNLCSVGRPGFDPWVGKIPWRRKWQPTPVFLLGESPWTEEPGVLQFHFNQGWLTLASARSQESCLDFPVCTLTFLSPGGSEHLAFEDDR